MIKPSYVPILRAKSGEFTALSELSLSTKSKILPLFDIPKNSSKAKIPKTDDEHLDSVVSSICGIWKGLPLLLDAFSWNPGATTSEGEHIMGYLQSNLESGGVEVSPVVGYDRWDDQAYQAAITSMALPEGRCFCLRLDRDAIDDIADLDYFKERIDEILLKIGSAASECIVLLDLADLSQQPVMDVLSKISGAISVLQALGFNQLIIGGSSIPASINIAVKTSESVGYLSRREMVIWQSLFQTYPMLVFGDYGVRSPHANEDIIAPDTNGKIRYTIDKNFFIARGYSLRTREKGAQHHELAAKVIQSPHYLGPDFSWGDKRITSCANGEFRGNSTTWIAIDTNHHVEAAVLEITEFKQLHAIVENA